MKKKNGVFIINAPEEAEQILRGNKGRFDLTFDISEDLDFKEIPLTLNKCQAECSDPHEYLGWNIWGHGFAKSTTYCTNCGYSLEVLASVAVAIQGSKVVQCNYRIPEVNVPS